MPTESEAANHKEQVSRLIQAIQAEPKSGAHAQEVKQLIDRSFTWASDRPDLYAMSQLAAAYHSYAVGSYYTASLTVGHPSPARRDLPTEVKISLRLVARKRRLLRAAIYFKWQFRGDRWTRYKLYRQAARACAANPAERRKIRWGKVHELLV